MNENAVISNKFTVSILEDGSQYTGALVSNNALTQAWNGTSAIPDWSTDVSSRPLIYMLLNYGGQAQSIDLTTSTFTWTYNNVTLAFNSQPVSPQETPLRYACVTTGYESIFELTSYTSGGVTVPALRVIGNLAGLDPDGSGGLPLNSDSDSIGFTVQIPLEGGRSFTVHDVIVVTITTISSSSMFGVLEATKMYLTSQDETTTITARLYEANGSAVSVPWYSRFFYFKNGVWTVEDRDSGASPHTLTISGSEFVDYETVTVEFRTEQPPTDVTQSAPDPVWTAVIGIDDLQDDDVMMITSALSNSSDFGGATFGPGADATMTSSQWIRFGMYMVKKEDITTPKATFPFFYVQLLDFKGDELPGSTPATTYIDQNYPVVNTGSGYPDYLRYLGAPVDNYHYMTLPGAEIRSVLKGSVTGMIFAYNQQIHQTTT